MASSCESSNRTTGGFTRVLLAAAAADDATPPPSPPLSGVFHHTLSGDVAYAAFDPVPAPAPAHLGHHGGKQPAPDPAFADFFHEPVAALASTRGLVCLRGTVTNAYYVANPATRGSEQLPRPAHDHRAKGEPQVVIAFDLDPRDSDPERADAKPLYRNYHVVVAFPAGDGIYAFESFSSRAWKWAVGDDVAHAEAIVPGSGVGVLGCAFWRTSLGPLLCYEPVSRCSYLVPAPPETIHQWRNWELGEMEGTLCVTCMDDRVDAVAVIRLDFGRRAAYGTVPWTLAGHFEGGCLRGRKDVKLLRSQGKAEVVMWDPSSETVVAMDIEGRTTRTITFVPGSAYYADFIPYVRSLAAISGSGLIYPSIEGSDDHPGPGAGCYPHRLGNRQTSQKPTHTQTAKVARIPSKPSVEPAPWACTSSYTTPLFQSRGGKGAEKMASSQHSVRRSARLAQDNTHLLEELPPSTRVSNWTEEHILLLCTTYLEERESEDAYEKIRDKLANVGATYGIEQIKLKVRAEERKYDHWKKR